MTVHASTRQGTRLFSSSVITVIGTVWRSIQTSRYKSVAALSLSTGKGLDPELFAAANLPCRSSRVALSAGEIDFGLATKLPGGSVYASVIDAATPNASHDAEWLGHVQNGHSDLSAYKVQRRDRDASDHGRFRGQRRLTDCPRAPLACPTSSFAGRLYIVPRNRSR